MLYYGLGYRHYEVARERLDLRGMHRGLGFLDWVSALVLGDILSQAVTSNTAN